MRYFVYLFSAINLYAGTRFLLNAVGILQTSKYSNGSNIFFGIVLFAAAVVAFVFLFTGKQASAALWIDIAPWALTLVLLVGNMMLGDYK
ncbi:hypothetical protein [Chryseolinea lacunae]|uniref:Uncharacterized protein n=1 Tax=Chryseolinea lacunae TaxID=2801331 RepID=A0ABS1KW63_9BACT|nr:hypothetical protein [Chryseolinea lacunae]MBL0743443.1 hypothetical protein [Chryseolinea lacunae]